MTHQFSACSYLDARSEPESAPSELEVESSIQNRWSQLFMLPVDFLPVRPPRSTLLAARAARGAAPTACGDLSLLHVLVAPADFVAKFSTAIGSDASRAMMAAFPTMPSTTMLAGQTTGVKEPLSAPLAAAVEPIAHVGLHLQAFLLMDEVPHVVLEYTKSGLQKRVSNGRPRRGCRVHTEGVVAGEAVEDLDRADPDPGGQRPRHSLKRAASSEPPVALPAL